MNVRCFRFHAGRSTDQPEEQRARGWAGAPDSGRAHRHEDQVPGQKRGGGRVCAGWGERLSFGFSSRVPLRITALRRHIAPWIDLRAKAGSDKVAKVVKHGGATKSKCCWPRCIPRVPSVARCGHSADPSTPPTTLPTSSTPPSQLLPASAWLPLSFKRPRWQPVFNVAPFLPLPTVPSY